jgi:hypothetical protein
MIKNIKKIQIDIKKKNVTKATNGMQLIVNGLSLFKRGLGLVISEIFKKKLKYLKRAVLSSVTKNCRTIDEICFIVQ